MLFETNYVVGELTYRTVKRWKGSQLYFDLEKCLLIPPQEVPNYTFQEEIKGGVLADKYWSITWKERALESMYSPMRFFKLESSGRMFLNFLRILLKLCPANQ